MNIEEIRNSAKRFNRLLDAVRRELKAIMDNKELLFDALAPGWYYENKTFVRDISSELRHDTRLELYNGNVTVSDGEARLVYFWDYDTSRAYLRLEVDCDNEYTKHEEFCSELRTRLCEKRKQAKQKIVNLGKELIKKEIESYMRYVPNCYSSNGQVWTKTVKVWSAYADKEGENTPRVISFSTREELDGEAYYSFKLEPGKTEYKEEFRLLGEDNHFDCDTGVIEFNVTFDKGAVFPEEVKATIKFNTCCDSIINNLCKMAMYDYKIKISNQAIDIAKNLEKEQWLLDENKPSTAYCIIDTMWDCNLIKKKLEDILDRSLFDIDVITTEKSGFNTFKDDRHEQLRIAMHLGK